MADRLDDETLAELQRLNDAATPGPWEADRDSIEGFDLWQTDGTYVALGGQQGAVEDHADAALITASRNALPSLLAEVVQWRSSDAIWQRQYAEVWKLRDIIERVEALMEQRRGLDSALERALRPVDADRQEQP